MVTLWIGFSLCYKIVNLRFNEWNDWDLVTNSFKLWPEEKTLPSADKTTHLASLFELIALKTADNSVSMSKESEFLSKFQENYKISQKMNRFESIGLIFTPGFRRIEVNSMDSILIRMYEQFWIISTLISKENRHFYVCLPIFWNSEYAQRPSCLFHFSTFFISIPFLLFLYF